MTDRALPRRILRSFEFDLPAPAQAVFPLLCPVRESEWLPGWQASIVFSESGLAEDHCVFTTERAGGAPSVWVVSHYDRESFALGFTIFEDEYVQRLDIQLVERGSGCGSCWTRTYTALSAAGARHIERDTATLHERMGRLEQLLTSFCRTTAAAAS